MPFQKYATSNLAKGRLLAGISASANSLILQTDEGDLFPSTFPYLLKIEKFDSTSNLENKPVIKREIVQVTNKSGDTFTITRSAGTVPESDTATTQGTTAFSFDSGDFVSLVTTSEQIQDIQDEVKRLETDKADDNVVVKLTGNQTVGGIKTFSVSPQVPTGTTGNDAVNKAQLDADILAASAVEALTDKDTYLLGEDADAGDSVFVEDMVDYNDDVSDYATGFSETSSSSLTQGAGYRILSNAIQRLVTVTKNNSCTATRAVLRDDAGTILATATFVVNVATFSTPYELLNGVHYRVHLDSDGGSYSRRVDGSPTLPASDFIEYVGGSRDTATNDTSAFNIQSLGTSGAINLQTQDIGDVAANTRVSIPVFGTGIASDELNLALRKYVSPGVDLGVRIETDDNGEPSGTLIDPNAEATVTEASLTTSLVDTTVVLGSSSNTNEHLVTLNDTQAAQTRYKGLKFAPTNTIGIVSVTKSVTSTATTCYIADVDGNIVSSSAFVANVATLNYNGVLAGQDYYILAGSGGSSYTSVRQTGSSAFPYSSLNGHFVDGGELTIGATDTEATPLSISGSGNGGVIILCNVTSRIQSITTDGTPNGATIQILDSTGATVLGSATVSSNVATFTTPVPITQGLQYRVLVIGTITKYRNNGTYNKTNISFVGPLGPFASGIYQVAVVTINTVGALITNNDVNNILSFVAGDEIQIPEGQRCHIVLYPGTYGSETVNGTNYFGIGYDARNTTTRPLNTYNGTIYGTPDNDIFTYVSSDLFTPKLLSLTDATYSYKLPTDLPRVLTESKTAGENAIATTLGLNDNFTGLTPETVMYLADTPGAISSTPGTNIYGIGEAITDTILDVKTSINSYITNITTLNILRGTSGTTISDSYLANSDQWCIIELNSRSSSGSYNTTTYFEYSYDNVNWTTFLSNATNSSSMLYKQFTVLLKKGVYYRTRAFLDNNSGDGITNAEFII